MYTHIHMSNCQRSTSPFFINLYLQFALLKETALSQSATFQGLFFEVRTPSCFFIVSMDFMVKFIDFRTLEPHFCWLSHTINSKVLVIHAQHFSRLGTSRYNQTTIC